jgi:hypothetical protein
LKQNKPTKGDGSDLNGNQPRISLNNPNLILQRMLTRKRNKKNKTANQNRKKNPKTSGAVVVKLKHQNCRA